MLNMNMLEYELISACNFVCLDFMDSTLPKNFYMVFMSMENISDA